MSNWLSSNTIKPDTGEIAEEDDEAEIAPPVPLV